MLIFDLATLRFSKQDGSVAVHSATGDLLGIAGDPATDVRECAVAACDVALRSGRVRHATQASPVGVVQLPIALLNPATMEIAVGALPRTIVLRCRAPLSLPPGGLLASFDGQAMVAAGAIIAVTAEARRTDLTRAWSEHQELL